MRIALDLDPLDSAGAVELGEDSPRGARTPGCREGVSPRTRDRAGFRLASPRPWSGAHGAGPERGAISEIQTAIRLAGGERFADAPCLRIRHGRAATSSRSDCPQAGRPARSTGLQIGRGPSRVGGTPARRLRWLERAHAVRDDELVYLKVDKRFEPLRAHPSLSGSDPTRRHSSLAQAYLRFAADNRPDRARAQDDVIVCGIALLSTFVSMAKHAHRQTAILLPFELGLVLGQQLLPRLARQPSRNGSASSTIRNADARLLSPPCGKICASMMVLMRPLGDNSA